MKRKKLLAVVLALAMVLSLTPMTALAEGLGSQNQQQPLVSVDSGAEATLASDQTLTEEITVSGTLTVAKGATLTIEDGGKLTVASGGKLVIANGGALEFPVVAGGSTLIPDSNATRVVKIEQGGKLDIAGTFKSGTADFSDIEQLGVMTIESTAKLMLVTATSAGTDTPAWYTYFGSGGAVSLSKGATIVSEPNTAGTYTGGYTYTLTGTAELNGYQKTGSDKFVVGEGATLTVSTAADLETAIAFTDGGTIKLGSDITSDGGFVIKNSEIVLDLNGKTLNVTEDDWYGAIEVNGIDAKLTIKDGGKGGKLVSGDSNYGVVATNGGTVAVESGTIESGGAALTGNNTKGNMDFIVNGGTLTAKYGPAIYMPGQVGLNITGGTLNGGISLRMGQVNISGGTINAITSNIDSPAQYYNYGGNAWLPDALYVFGGTYTSKDENYGNSLNLNITGGTFNCSNNQGSAVAVYDLGKVAQTMNVNISGSAALATATTERSAYQVLKLTDIPNHKTSISDYAQYNQAAYVGKVNTSITGGKFSSDPTAYCAEGMTAVASGNSKYPYEVKALDTDVKVAAAAPTVEADTAGKSNDQVNAMTAAAESLKTENAVSASGLEAVAGNEAVKVDSDDLEKADSLLEGDSVDTAGKTVTVYVQPYLDIAIKNAEVDSSNTSKITELTAEMEI